MQTTAKAIVLNGVSKDNQVTWTPEDQSYLELCIASTPELQSLDC